MEELMDSPIPNDFDHSPREKFEMVIAYLSGHLKVLLNLIEKYNISGGFRTVFRLNISLSDLINSTE